MRDSSPGWRRRAQKGRLVLEDGRVFSGVAFGAPRSAAGEVVFTTGMVGYPEALTDRSYRGQILVLTYPSQGNYGVPRWVAAAPVPDGAKGVLPSPPFESDRIHLSGVVCTSYSEHYSHRSAAAGLGEWLVSQGVPADGASLPRGWDAWIADVNDGTNEGIRHMSGSWRSVQLHPEAAPGPTRTEWILEEFLEEIS